MKNLYKNLRLPKAIKISLRYYFVRFKSFALKLKENAVIKILIKVLK